MSRDEIIAAIAEQLAPHLARLESLVCEKPAVGELVRVICTDVPTRSALTGLAGLLEEQRVAPVAVLLSDFLSTRPDLERRLIAATAPPSGAPTQSARASGGSAIAQGENAAAAAGGSFANTGKVSGSNINLGGIQVVAPVATGRLLDHLAQAVADLAGRLGAGQPLPLPDDAAGLERIVRDHLAFVDAGPWLDRMRAATQRTCRIEIEGSLGTGFLVGPDLVLTNYHVVEECVTGKTGWDRVSFRFGHRLDSGVSGASREVIVGAAQQDPLLDASPYCAADLQGWGSPGEEELDYAFVRLERALGNEPEPGSSEQRGWFKLEESPPPPAKGQPLFILQHPGGAPLKLALDTDGVIGLNATGSRLLYHTNTEPGSSGSPCFDCHGRLVALHHLGDPASRLGRPAQYNQGVPITRIRDLRAKRSARAGLQPAFAASQVALERAGSKELEDGSWIYTVWFGTDRKPLDPQDPSRGFAGARGEATSFGHCKVAIPRTHRFGSTGTSFLRRWVRLEFRDDHLRLQETKSASMGDWLSSIQDELKGLKDGDRQSIVYIHGYNVSFEEAALRAAQIGFDLKVPGITAFFSWPSRGKTQKYLADREAVEASEGAMADFLAKVARESGSESVHVLVHSMGNRVLLRALQRIVCRAERYAGVRFGKIILAAPDISVDLFRALSPAFARISDRTTLYSSPADLALTASEWLQDTDRAGHSPPITVVSGIDTVHVPRFDLLSLGHSYYAEAEAVLHDMHDNLFQGTPAKDRQRLETRRNEQGLEYSELQR